MDGDGRWAGGPNRGRAPEAVDGALDAADAGALLGALEGSDHFRRDTRLGGILHPGKISFREVRETGSLHIVLDGDRVSAHVDDVSPLVCAADGTTRFSWKRVLAHNLAVVVADRARRVRGQAGKQRCNLVCGTVWVDDDPSTT